MTKLVNILNAALRFSVGILLASVFALTAAAQGKTPIIVIPGLTGSELVNSKTGEHVWFKAPRSKDDDLRLPISTNLAKVRDNLVPGDILRSIKFGIFPRMDIYGGLIETLTTKAGYHEESFDNPTAKGFEDSVYVYPYDWRLDNVENARLLIRKIERLRLKLKKPGLKFNVIAHSMGGIIARYAAMYGDADLPTGNRKPVPTWAGSKFFEKIVLLGTPNEGSALSLNSMVNGFAIGGININLPWIQNLSKFDLFTIPSGYQLLPAPGTFHALDENFKPIDIDLYNPKEWSKYGWNAIEDKGFAKQFKLSERRAAPAFFAEMLDRAKRLHAALDAGLANSGGVEIDLIGADCKESLDAVVLYRDAKSDKWKTLFKPAGFTRDGGTKVPADDLKAVMQGPGDGVVTTRSLISETGSKTAGDELRLHSASTSFICEEHNKLAANADIQAKILEIFAGVKAK